MKTKNYLLIVGILISSFVYSQRGTTIPGSFTVGGTMRTYTIYVPKIYDSLNIPVPLVFNVHGLSGTCDKQTTAEDFRKIADTANFILVLPQGLSTSTFGVSLPGWDVWNTVAAGQPDRDFIINLLDTVESRYKINTNRVYTAGFSQGAYMSYNLGCQNSLRFAAVSSTSGSMATTYLTACNAQHPTPVIEIHGNNDALVSYTGGSATTTATETVVKYWVDYNHCNPVPTIDSLADVADSLTVDMSKVIHYVYTGGTKGATVEFYKVLNGGHQIPSLAPVPTGYGIGNTNQDFTAAKEIWRFFSKYSLDMLTDISENKIENNDVSIYPNPSNGIFTIEIKNNQSANITVYNVLGEVVFNEKISNRSIINLGNASSGVYFYQVGNQTSIIKSGKLIVQ